MKISFLASAPYAGPAPRGQWPLPPSACDPEIAARSLADNIALAQRAEAAGFDWVSVSEHHFAGLMLTPNPLVYAAALTQALSRVKIALLGPLVPLANPVRLAEEVAMLDCLSNGRIVVCFLRGTPNEQHVYAKQDDARGVTQEGVDLILKALTEPAPFSWEGKHFKFETVSVWPRVVQRPHPPVYHSGNSEESAIFAGARKLGLAMSFLQPPAIKQTVAIYHEAATKAGWTPTREHVLYRCISDVSESEAAFAAHKRADASNSPLPAFLAPMITGPPRRALDTVREIFEAGVGVLDVAGLDARQIDAYGAQLIPEARAWT